MQRKTTAGTCRPEPQRPQKAIVLGVLLFELLEPQIEGELRLTTDPAENEDGTLTLYEAFVAGSHKVTDAPAAEKAPDEWDAFVAALAWGNIHGGFKLPQGFQAVTLHEAGSAEDDVISIWSTIRCEGDVDGPLDCEVVALE